MVTRQAAPRVAAIVLAAGGSTRMGRPKQLLPIHGQPMVRHVTEVACGADLAQVIVVVGAQAVLISEALKDMPIDIATNQAWSTGLSSSIRVGLQALRPDTDAALIVLADQPALAGDSIRRVIEAYLTTTALVVAPTHRGRRGHPVLFDRALFGELMTLTGDQGARDLLQRHHCALHLVEVNHIGVVLDVDTYQNYSDVEGTSPHEK